MLSFFKEYKRFAIGFLILSGIIITIFYYILNPSETLPVFEPADINADLVDENLQHQKKYHKIADFKLTNQNGETVTQDDYKDKIYVADFFFTTCQTICPVMTKNMVKVQDQLKDEGNVMLLSHTVTPEIDDVARLKEYSETEGIDDNKWNLVTGDKKQIYDLARKSYLAVKDVEDDNDYGMIHTENFVLIDKQKRIRGMYDGTDTTEINRLLHDIDVLIKEYQ